MTGRIKTSAIPIFITLVVLIVVAGSYVQRDMRTETDEDHTVYWIAEADTVGDIVFKLHSSQDGDADFDFRSARRTGSVSLNPGEVVDVEVSMTLKRTDIERNARCSIRTRNKTLVEESAIVRNGSRRDAVFCSATVHRVK